MQEEKNARTGDEKEPHTQIAIDLLGAPTQCYEEGQIYVDADAAKLEDVMGAYERFLKDPIFQ